MIKRGRASKLDIFRVAQLATAVYSPSGSDPQASASSDGDGNDTPASSGEGGSEGSGALAGLSDADIEGMDAATLRRMLVARGLPGSGRISKLRERLRELRDGK
jgi:hypothetical protein